MWLELILWLELIFMSALKFSVSFDSIL